MKRLRTKLRELEAQQSPNSTQADTKQQGQQSSGTTQSQGQAQGQKQQQPQQNAKGHRQDHGTNNGNWIKSSSGPTPADMSRLRAPSHSSRNGLTVGSVFYGVTSLPYYLTRLSQFVRSNRYAQQLDIDFDLGIRSPNSPALRGEDPFLFQDQESHFLDIFWQTFYFSYPIFNEGQIRGHFRSLWSNVEPGALREGSPLIDIVLALCIQHGSGPMPRQNMYPVMRTRMGSISGSSPSTNTEVTSSLAGFQYYQRCQDALDQAIETPSITTVQAYILSIIYLYQAGLLNRAQVVSGKAIMVAMMMRLQDEPLASDPEPLKEIARRTWWSLYTVDAMLSVEIGRPPMISPSHSTCSPPSDSDDVAQWFSPHYSYDPSSATWLGFQTQTLRLLDAVTDVRNVLCAKYDSLVGDTGFEVFTNNPSAREECAQLLNDQMRELSAWAKQVPAKFQMARRDDGQPFSTDLSMLDFSPTVLLQNQRQRLLLELQYHQYCINLCQMFICFGKTGDMPTPMADNRASAALSHAMTFTGIAHQALTSSEAINGCYQVFRWQKNAVFTMIGYSYTYPVGGLLGSVRSYIETGIAVMDMYRDVLPEAASVVNMARVLADDVNGVVNGFHAGNYGRSLSVSTIPAPPPLSHTASYASHSTASSGTPMPTPMASTPMTMQASSTTIMSAGPGPMLCEDNYPKQEFGPLLINDGLLDMDFLHGMGAGGPEERATSEPMDMLWASLDFTGGANSMDPWGM